MNSKALTAVALAVAAVLMIVTSVILNINSSVMREIRDQQQLIIENQLSILDRMDSAGGGFDNQRLAAMEKNLNALITAIKGAIQPQPAGPPPENMDTVHTIPLEDTPVKGEADAPITITEFVDFQCPYCARFHSVINEVYEAYPGQVKHVIKNFPLSFHPQARPAAYAALAAGEQGRYFEMADLLLENFRDLSEDTFGRLAEEIGLDTEKFWQDFHGRQDEWNRVIRRDLDLGRKVDVRGTPTFYLNGKKTNARTLEAYKREIDTILGE